MKNIFLNLCTSMILMLSAVHIHAQTPAKNKAMVLKAYREMNNNHNTADWTTLPGGYIPYWPGQGLKAGFAQYYTAIPDAKFIVEDVTAEGNSVTVELLSTGTFKNRFMDWEPTSKPFSYRSTHTLTFDKKGEITDGWPFPDPALYLR